MTTNTVYLKICLTRDCVKKLKDLQPTEKPARTAKNVLESVMKWDGDMISLMYHIAHTVPEGKK